MKIQEDYPTTKGWCKRKTTLLLLHYTHFIILIRNRCKVSLLVFPSLPCLYTSLGPSLHEMNFEEVFSLPLLLFNLNKFPNSSVQCPQTSLVPVPPPHHFMLSHSLPMTTFLTIKLVCGLLSMHKLHVNIVFFLIMLKICAK